MSTPELTSTAAFEHWITSPVRFSDTDAVGHVNNVALAAHVEAGRVAFAGRLASSLHAQDRWITLRRVEIDYLSEAFYPGQLRVGSRLLAVGRTSFTVGTGVFDDDRCVATARGVLVLVGPDGPAPIEGTARARLEAEL